VSSKCAVNIFEGDWFLTQNLEPDIPALNHTCILEDCVDSVLISLVHICPQQTLRISSSTIIMNITLDSSDPPVCITVEVSVSSILSFTEPVTTTVGMTFVRANGSEIENSYSVIQNRKRFTIGQMVSDVITIHRISQSKNEENVPVLVVDLCFDCLLCDNIDEVDSRFVQFDLGYNWTDNRFGVKELAPSVIFNEDSLVCFLGVELTEETINLVLVKRLEEYKNYDLLYGGERSVLITSAILYGISAVVIIISQFSFGLLFASLSIIAITFQSVSLVVIRSVYLFLISVDQDRVRVGSITDYILVEIPTFFYLQILIQILLSLFLFTRSSSEKVSNENFDTTSPRQKRYRTWGVIFLCWGGVWLGFLAVVIALSEVKTDAIITESCGCRLFNVKQPSNATLYIRIAYKSVIFVIALCIFILITLFGRSFFYDSRRSSFYQIVMVSIFLIINCLGFVIYYAINKPNPYFVIFLLCTELTPILLLNIVLAKPGLKYLRNRLSHFIK
jgi:hypothetical protein